jgi:hypothetical protein
VTPLLHLRLARIEAAIANGADRAEVERRPAASLTDGEAVLEWHKLSRQRSPGAPPGDHRFDDDEVRDILDQWRELTGR